MEGVSVIYGDSSVLTDADGYYFYSNIPDGLQGVRFRMNGYYPVMSQVNISAGGETVCDVVMDIITAGWAVGAGDSDYGTILYSPDGGRSWVRQGTPDMIPDVRLKDVFAVDDQVCWVAGEADTLRGTTVLLFTEDGGATWSNQGSSLRTSRPVSIAAIVAHDKDTAWAVTSDTCMIYAAPGPVLYLSGTGLMGVLRSADGGRTWEQALSSDVDVNALDACFDNYVWAAGSDGVMYVSADGLATSDEIHPADGGYSSGTLSSVAFLRDALRGACSVLSYTGETGTIYYTVDGGLSWNQSSVPYEFGVESVDFVGFGTVFVIEISDSFFIG